MLVVLPAIVYVNVLASKAVMINVPSYSGCVAPAMATVSLVLKPCPVAVAVTVVPDEVSDDTETVRTSVKFTEPTGVPPNAAVTVAENVTCWPYVEPGLGIGVAVSAVVVVSGITSKSCTAELLVSH